MKHFNSFIIHTLLIGLSCQLAAQSLKRAERVFNKYDYVTAIELYESIIKNKNEPSAMINLAESYRRIGDYENAERVFRRVVKLKQAKPIHSLYYGQALMINGKHEKAQKWFEKYNAAFPGEIRGQNMIDAAAPKTRNNLLASGAAYTIKKVDNVNSEYDDFSPVYYKNGIVFSSERSAYAAGKIDHSWTGLPFLDLYYSKATQIDMVTLDYNHEKPERYARSLKTRLHDGPAVFTKEEDRIYFTRNNIQNGKAIKSGENVVNLKIYSAKVGAKEEWTEMTELAFNSDDYNVCHPAISADGNKLIFSSDMADGLGGMDLYISYKKNGIWSPAVNLGPHINTEGNEVFPTLHEDGTLFFASDGQIGLGGLDIFMSMEDGNELGTPENLGYPINGNSDDFGLVVNNEKTAGYFVSDRKGGEGRDDIYSFTRFVSPVEVLVYDKATGEPIPKARVDCQCLAARFETNNSGRYQTEMAVGKACDFMAYKKGYETDPTQKLVHMNPGINGVKTLVKIPLIKESNYKLTGVVLNELTGKPLGGALVVLENTCGKSMKTTRADENGNYSFKVNDNCCYIVSGSKHSFNSNTIDVCPNDELTSANLPLMSLNGLAQPADPSFEPGDAVSGSSIILEHIYYDFDESYIREEASPDLQRLLAILKANPTIIVEIGSHTDARGTVDYNNGLSLRRAKAVVAWLTQNGVTKNRLLFRGYGETQTLNGCFDNIPCDEPQHQRNRRTEFRIVGTLDGKTINQLSIPPVEIKVDPCTDCSF